MLFSSFNICGLPKQIHQQRCIPQVTYGCWDCGNHWRTIHVLTHFTEHVDDHGLCVHWSACAQCNRDHVLVAWVQEHNLEVNIPARIAGIALYIRAAVLMVNSVVKDPKPLGRRRNTSVKLTRAVWCTGIENLLPTATLHNWKKCCFM